MVIALRVDYDHISAVPEAVENAEIIEPDETASVVNVHANFVIPEDQRYQDGPFPHLALAQKLARAADERGSLVSLADIPAASLGARPFRRPDYGGEWKLLKKAWNLHRNGREKLARRQMEAGSLQYYADDPLTDVRDWIWRFVMMIGGPRYAPIFENAFATIHPLFGDNRFADFQAFYNAEMCDVRAERYREVMKQFFSAYSEFGQILFPLVSNVAMPLDHRASSSDFDAVRMFYGNAYEAFSSCVDLLAYINNLISGRKFSEFAQLTQEQYLKLDKPARFTAFALNAPFTAICQEADNQIRNASHHGSFIFDSVSQQITYRAGKGGTGPEQQISYVDYLRRSTALFLQMMVLFRIELLMCQVTGARTPV